MSRPLPTVDLNWLHEDKIIIGARRALEIIWFTLLTPTNQADWLTRWLTHSPYDITGHVYTPYTPAKFSETKVNPETAYAWSQIYGFHRFKSPAVHEPTSGAFISPTCGNLTLSESAYTIDYDASALATPTVNLIVFASGPQTAGGKQRPPKAPSPYSPRPASLRPMCAMPSLSPTGTLDFWQCWHHRYTGPLPLFITATVAAVNVNNELIRSLDVPTAGLPP